MHYDRNKVAQRQNFKYKWKPEHRAEMLLHKKQKIKQTQWKHVDLRMGHYVSLYKKRPE